MVMAETSAFGILHGRNVRGRNVLAEMSVAETSVAEISYIRIDIALCVTVHDVEISPPLTTNNRWNSQSFEMNDAWKTVNHSILGITNISDKIFRCS